MCNRGIPETIINEGADIYDVRTGRTGEVKKLTIKLCMVEDGGSGEGVVFRVENAHTHKFSL